MNSFRAGMQVHAVPDDERATDANGKPLPWAYSYADSSLNRKQPTEKGPFGKPTSRRASSRTKTATPGPREDPVVAENMKTFDEIFGRHRKEVEDKDIKAPREQRGSVANVRAAQPQQSKDMIPSAQAPPDGQKSAFKEPTEVLLYGFGRDRQAQALAFFENLSRGRFYEDYDRDIPGARYNNLFSNNVRASIPRSLPKDAIRKINTYQGGEHWIKVTFDSPEAAEAIIFSSPHNLEGYLVYAERWMGVGPNQDVPFPAEPTHTNTLSHRRPTQPLQRRPFSTMPSRLQSQPSSGVLEQPIDDSPDTTETQSSATAVGVASGTDAQPSQPAAQRRPEPQQPAQQALKIPRATRAVFRPASEALLPMPPWTQRTFGHIPVVGSLFGGDPNSKPGQGGGIIGNAVPRRDDGSFDWETASTYWRLCWCMDSWLGTDLCGMKGDD